MPKKSRFLANLRDRVRKNTSNNRTAGKHGKKNSNSNGKHSSKNGGHHQKKKPKPSQVVSGPISYKDLLEPLPSIRETKDNEEKRRLFIIKLRLCSYTFNFKSDSKTQTDSIETQQKAEAREMKRRMLVELIDHLSSSKIWVSEESLKAILHMIGCNLFRPLPPSLYADFDPEEDEPTHDPAWVHLQFVYEFLLRFIVSNNTDAKMLKKFIDRKFLLSIINLFHSEDPRERDYLKTILHRIYGKFMSFRSFLRRAMNDVFYSVIYTRDTHNGLAELLEILGSIINGFATPLKEEHQLFLRNILIPLHKTKNLSQFHAQLAYCIVQFIEKDPLLASQVVGGLLKFWPQSSCNKELLYLSELEEVLEMTQQKQLEILIYPVFKRISDCIGSNHFQIAERALFLWNNDVIAAFMSDHRPVVLPLLYPALYKNQETHWNSTVTQLTQHIMQQFRDMDEPLYMKVEHAHIEYINSNTKAKQRRENWANLRKISTQNAQRM